MSKTELLFSLLSLNNNYLPSVFPISVTHAKIFGIILESSLICFIQLVIKTCFAPSSNYILNLTLLLNILPPLCSKSLHLLPKLLKGLLTGFSASTLAPVYSQHNSHSDYFNTYVKSDHVTFFKSVQ